MFANLHIFHYSYQNVWNWRQWCVGVGVFLNANNNNKKTKKWRSYFIYNVIYMHCSMWTIFHIQSRFTCCLRVYHSMHFAGIGSLWKHEDGNCRENLSHTKTNRFKSMWLPQASEGYYCANTSAYCVSLLLFYCCCTLDFLFVRLTPFSYYPWAEANIQSICLYDKKTMLIY